MTEVPGKKLGPESGIDLLIEGRLGIDPGGSEDARRQFRNTLSHFATGVTCMTTFAPDGGRMGITVSSFNSLSLDPPLILWSIANNTASFNGFQIGTPFAVNVLSADQEYLAVKFAEAGGDKFAGVSTHSGLDGVPLIDGCVVYLECTVAARYPGGDHDIIVGRVRRIFNIGKKPLLFHGGALRTLG
jgi:3-hydroxy-9,10-secoandrosta-1,3,5(10)-triene-9,17-dione monooxygenase reductase component